jgi:hypothetical protein
MKKLIIILLFTISLIADIQISTGIGNNSDKDIAYQKALDSAKIEALNMSKVFIKSQLETIKHQYLDSFKKEFNQKVFQKSEGLVSLIEVLNKKYSKNGQIYICEIKAKFDIKQSDIANSLEIMKRLDSLSNTKANQDDIKSLQNQIKELQNKISNQALASIIQQNSQKVVNQIKIQNNIAVQVVNSTDDMLYFMVGGLIIVIIILILVNAKTKNIVVNVETQSQSANTNPTINDIADMTRQDDIIKLSLDKTIFYKGEKLRINFEINSEIQKWYIYAYNIDDNFDIVFLDLIEDDVVFSNSEYIFPTWSDGYDIAEPFGDDIIKVFISDKKLPKPKLEDIQSEIFDDSNFRGLENTRLNQKLSQKQNISKYDIVGFYRGFKDECNIHERSIFYSTKES